MKTPVTHKLSPEWAQHCAEVLQQVRQFEDQAAILDGKAAQIRNEVAFMKRHLSVTIGTIEKADKLPTSLTPYRLTEDGSALVGEMEVDK